MTKPIDVIGQFLTDLGLENVTSCFIYCDWKSREVKIVSQQTVHQVDYKGDLLRVEKNWRLVEEEDKRMGCKAYVDYDKFPKQGKWLGSRVDVCFRYDTTHTVKGRIIRDDAEEPYLTIIQLFDGRVVLATECQYAIAREARNDSKS